MNRRFPFLFAKVVLLVACGVNLSLFAASGSDQPTPDVVQYNRDIRPILSSKCFQCHGYDAGTREAGLRLDDENDSRDAIKPGRAEESELVLRIESQDPDTIMPPPSIAKPITVREQTLIRRWIEQGAKYENHWAYEPLAVRPPETASLQQKASEIDAMLRRRWKLESTEPVARATPHELIRRLSFDLRGLPPQYEDVQAFEANPSRESYQRFVDRWIDSIEYAENQAMRWLDLVRFSDTTGLVSDEPIATGLYRRYVINSFHNNQPFDEFTIEQLAGDLLDDPNDEQLIASAYNRLIKTNCEAGVIDQEALYAMKGEHVRGVGAVWLGATTGCAECHDHKFDPITAKDYYSLAAFFDDLVEVGVYTPGDRRLPIHFVHDSQRDRDRDRVLSAKLRDLKKQLAATLVNDSALAKWKAEQIDSLRDQETRDTFHWIDPHHATAMVHDGDYETTTRAGRPARLTTSTGTMTTHRIAEVMTGFFVPKSYVKKDPQSRLFIEVYLDPSNRPSSLAVQLVSGDYGRVGWKPSEFLNFVWGSKKATNAAAESLSPAKATISMGEIPAVEGWTRLEIPCDKIDLTYELVGVTWGHLGGTVGWGDTGLDTIRSTATELRLAETLQRMWWDEPHYRMTYEDRMMVMRNVILGTAGQPDSLQASWMRAAYTEATEPEVMRLVRELQAELFRLRSHAKTTVVSRASATKVTRVLPRGNFMDESGAIVQPAIPEFLGKLETVDRRANRLDLAKWIVSDENPITARVFANRAWEQFFGHGISRTLEDSGGQGDWPSNLELLDRLAAEFRDSGWDRKHLTRLLVSTDAYQLSSMPTEALVQRDPENEWFARQSRHRLRGEQIRDAALVTAGRFQATTVVPIESFFPYQPNDYWDRSCKVMYGSRHMLWEPSPDEQQYQRTLYTFWKRQNIHPMLLALDAPTRQECTTERTATNTPGQALTMLNDPIFVDAAIGLAARVCNDSNRDLSDEERIKQLFRFSLQRLPTDMETKELVEFTRSQLAYYRSDPDEATKLLSLGRVTYNDSESSISHASWTIVARVLLNTHEFMTRN